MRRERNNGRLQRGGDDGHDQGGERVSYNAAASCHEELIALPGLDGFTEGDASRKSGAGGVVRGGDTITPANLTRPNMAWPVSSRPWREIRADGPGRRQARSGGGTLDHRHRRLLRARSERPRSSRAAKHTEKFAPLHRFTRAS